MKNRGDVYQRHKVPATSNPIRKDKDYKKKRYELYSERGYKSSEVCAEKLDYDDYVKLSPKGCKVHEGHYKAKKENEHNFQSHQEKDRESDYMKGKKGFLHHNDNIKNHKLSFF